MQKALTILLINLITFNTMALKFHNIEKPYNIPDNIAIFDIQQKPHTMEEFEGNTLLLVFWATWCSACVKELPELDILQKDFRKLPFKIIAVSQDFLGIQAIEKFYKTENIKHLDIYHDYHNQLFKALEVIGIPTAFLVDPNGKALVKFTGSVSWHDDAVREILLSHMLGNPAMPKNSYLEQSLNHSYKLDQKENNNDAIQSPKK